MTGESVSKLRDWIMAQYQMPRQAGSAFEGFLNGKKPPMLDILKMFREETPENVQLTRLQFHRFQQME